jgi:hypothetical protein
MACFLPASLLIFCLRLVVLVGDYSLSDAIGSNGVFLVIDGCSEDSRRRLLPEMGLRAPLMHLLAIELVKRNEIILRTYLFG